MIYLQVGKYLKITHEKLMRVYIFVYFIIFTINT